MINLSEEWKKAYSAYLDEKDDLLNEEIEDLSKELLESQSKVEKSFDILREYYEAYSEMETLAEWVPGKDDEDKKELEAERKAAAGGTSNNFNFNSEKGGDKTFSTQAVDLFSKLLADGKASASDTYSPMATYTVTKIGDMKFPQNLIFFLKNMVKWIAGVVIYIIEKILNVIRFILKRPLKELDLSKLKLDLSNAKKIESTVSTVDISDKGLSDYFKKNWRFTPYKALNADNVALSEDDISVFNALFPGFVKDAKPTEPDKETVVVSIDFSKDLEDLNLLIQHFYDLYDNAYGSNNEKLFDTEDLEIILKLFKDAVSRIKTGNSVQTITLMGNSTEVDLISADKVKRNLVITAENISNLKSAYSQTSQKIAQILQVISEKEMSMIDKFGFNRKFISYSTYNNLTKILKFMPARLREARGLEKDLSKMKSKYEKISKELESMQSSLISISNVTFTSTYNRKIVEMLNATKYMTQTISLRLSGLALYVKQLKDIRDCVTAITNMNAPKGIGKKIRAHIGTHI